MRKMALAFVTAVMASLTVPAVAQSWLPGSFTFTQGQTYTRTFETAGTDSFEAASIEIWYPDAVFAPIALLTGMTPGALTVEAGPILDADPLLGLPAGTKNIFITVLQSEVPIPFSSVVPAGPFFGIEFQVKSDAPVGLHDVLVTYELSLADGSTGESLLGSPFMGSADFTATIVAVPEPETWAMMLAGIALVGFAARARRNRA